MFWPVSPFSSRVIRGWPRTLSLMQVVVLFGLGNDLRGQEKSSPERNSEAVTNTNLVAVSGSDQHTNAPVDLFGGSPALPQVPVSLRPFQLVLAREHLFGDWLGLRSKVE